MAEKPYIGVILGGHAEPPAGIGRRCLEALRDGLSDYGVQEVELISRFAQTDQSRFPALIQELFAEAQQAEAPLSALVIADTEAIQPYKQLVFDQRLPPVPAVVPVSYDLVDHLTIESLGHPGSCRLHPAGDIVPGLHVTGLYVPQHGAIWRRLETLRAVAPGLTQLVVVRGPSSPCTTRESNEADDASQVLGMSICARIDITTPADVQDQDTLDQLIPPEAEMLVMLSHCLTTYLQQPVINVTRARGILTAFTYKEAVEAGGLLAWGPDRFAMVRRSAAYLKRILEAGESAADMPLEPPPRYELAFNRGTLDAIISRYPEGVRIPPHLETEAIFFP